MHVVLALQFRIVSPVILIRTGQWILVLQGLVSLVQPVPVSPVQLVLLSLMQVVLAETATGPGRRPTES